MQEEFLNTTIVWATEHLRGCRCACGGWTWGSGYGSFAGALHCRTYCEIGDDRTVSGSEIGYSVCVSHGGNGSCIDRDTFNIHIGSLVIHVQFLYSCFQRQDKHIKSVNKGRVLCQCNSHSPRFRPGPRPRFRAGVAGAFFWAGRRASRGAACRLPWAPRAHAPGCRARLLNEPHTPTHLLSAPMRGQTEKCA